MSRLPRGGELGRIRLSPKGGKETAGCAADAFVAPLATSRIAAPGAPGGAAFCCLPEVSAERVAP